MFDRPTRRAMSYAVPEHSASDEGEPSLSAILPSLKSYPDMGSPLSATETWRRLGAETHGG